MQSILIVEDLEETRNWLAGIVRAAFGACAVQEASCVRTGMAQLAAQTFDLALIDLGLPDGSGLKIVRELRGQQPEAFSVVTTVMGDDTSIIKALAAGATGYLLKESSTEVLIRQLTLLAEGIPPLSPSVARRIMGHFRLTGPVAAGDDVHLTEREREVLFLIGRGLSNREVAVMLKLSEGTIGSYIKGIYRKLGICSRAEAAWCAARFGLGLD